MVVLIRPPADFTRLSAASTMRSSRPVRAIAPPKPMALIIRPMVSSILSMPPLDSSASMDSLPLTELKPKNIAVNRPLKIAAELLKLASAARVITASHWNITAKIQPATTPQISVERAGLRIIAMTNSSTRGVSINGLTKNASCIAAWRISISSTLTLMSLPMPSIKNSPRVITKLGTVVQSICSIWSNKSLLVTAAARLVVSERGDNLSPK